MKDLPTRLYEHMKQSVKNGGKNQFYLIDLESLFLAPEEKDDLIMNALEVLAHRGLVDLDTEFIQPSCSLI